MVKISVVLATKNGQSHLDQAIQSILNQTESDFELIICNDHSTDATQKIIQKYATQDARIKSFDGEFPVGFTNALNYGFSHCSGKYIARMDDDDIAHKTRLEVQANYLDQYPGVAIVGSNINFFDDQGVYGHTKMVGIPTKIDIWRGKLFAHPTVMLRKFDVAKVGMYCTATSVVRIEDYEYWCRFYAYGLVGINLTDTLLDYREDNQSFKKRDIKRRIRLVKSMYKWRRRLGVSNWYSIFMLYELFKILVPQKLIQCYHRHHFRLE